jgi:NAD+-dependent protein deacetylase SIR2
LYNQVGNKRNFQDPQTLFETDTFLSVPQEFWEDVKPIIPKLTTAINTSTAIVETIPKYGPVHAFLNLLQSKDKLLTVFTQNIDGLELAAGVAERKTIKCHGSWDSATCITCKGKVGANGYLPVVYAGLLPLCSCAMPTIPDATTVVRRGSRARKGTADADAKVQYIDTHGGLSQTTSSQLSPKKTGKKRRREDSDDDSGAADSVGRPGLIKPDITFFGEDISSSLVFVRSSMTSICS